jgi:hypothetical protein
METVEGFVLCEAFKTYAGGRSPVEGFAPSPHPLLLPCTVARTKSMLSTMPTPSQGMSRMLTRYGD